MPALADGVRPKAGPMINSGGGGIRFSVRKCDRAKMLSGFRLRLVRNRSISRASQQAEIAQLPPQRFGHHLGSGRGAIEVARRVLRGQVAPTLEGAPGARLDQGQLRFERQAAATDALLVAEGTHREDPLPARDLAADDPIERAAIRELGGALGNHAGRMQMLAAEAAPLALLEPRANPVLQILHRVAADAEFDEMKRHDGESTDLDVCEAGILSRYAV